MTATTAHNGSGTAGPSAPVPVPGASPSPLSAPATFAAPGGSLVLDAEALYGELLRGVRSLRTPDTRLAGVASGGAWLVERLQKDLGLDGAPGVLSSALHRDDFAQRGLSSSTQTTLAFDVNGADILVLDDVLYTGRTVRAVLNELYDYGRPARVRLAVLVDRGGRELPVQADFAAARVALPARQSLALARSDAGAFHFQIREV